MGSRAPSKDPSAQVVTGSSCGVSHRRFTNVLESTKEIFLGRLGFENEGRDEWIEVSRTK